MDLHSLCSLLCHYTSCCHRLSYVGVKACQHSTAIAYRFVLHRASWAHSHDVLHHDHHEKEPKCVAVMNHSFNCKGQLRRANMPTKLIPSFSTLTTSITCDGTVRQNSNVYSRELQPLTILHYTESFRSCTSDCMDINRNSYTYVAKHILMCIM